MAEQIIPKKCTVCKQIKPLSEFYKNCTTKDGYRNECKICHSKYTKKYFQTKRGKEVNRKAMQRYQQSEKRKITKKRYSQTEKGKITKKRHRQTEKYKTTQRHYQQSKEGKIAQKRYNQSGKGIANQKRYHICHPKCRKAESAVNYAIKIGRLPRPDTLQCYYCPKQAEQYHHWSYAPEHFLDVIPVCVKCHHNYAVRAFSHEVSPASLEYCSR